MIKGYIKKKLKVHKKQMDHGRPNLKMKDVLKAIN